MSNVVNINHVVEIVTDYDKLSDRCEEINLSKDNKIVQEIVLKLKNTIRAHENITALSANQIGYNKRILCLNFNGDIRSFINPVIQDVKGLELSREKCHSEPEREFIRTRHSKVTVMYQTPLGKIETVELVGMAARVFQHHLDHLDGLLLSDVSLEVFDDFDNATDEERQEIINMYLDSLDLKQKQIKTEIENDPETHQLSEAVRFINSVESGETEIEQVELDDDEVQHIKKIDEEYKELKTKK